MITPPATQRRLRLWAVALALAGIVAGVLVWQLFPQGRSAQAAFEDACASMENGPALEHAAFDLSSNLTMTRGDVVQLSKNDVRYSFSPHYARHEVESLMDGTVLREVITLVQPDEGSGARSSGDTEVSYSVNSYYRHFDEQGGTAGWNAQTEPLGQTASQARNADTMATFCGMDVNELYINFRYLGEEELDGVTTKHFTGTNRDEPDGHTVQTDYWIESDSGFPAQQRVERVQTTVGFPTNRLIVITKFVGWGEENVITAPVVETPQATPEATPAPTVEPTPVATVGPTSTPWPTPTREPTPTPGPVATPVPTPEPTATPEPTPTPSTPTVDAWLEPDPTTITFDDGQWRQFEIRGTGLERVDLATNVINYPDGPSSTGAVELESRRTVPSATDACRATYYSEYERRVGDTFSMVGCRAGTVILQLADPSNNTVIREYTVTVSGGP